MKEVKNKISICAFISAIIIGFCALWIPPMGIIDASVLWFTAQLLLFTSALLGVNLSLDSISMRGKAGNKISE